jgi:hypothetical protein
VNKAIIILFLLVSNLLVGQKIDATTNKDPELKAYKNQIDIDIELLGLSLGYNRRISPKSLIGLFIGGGGGAMIGYRFGTKSSRNSFNKSGFMGFEVLHIGINFNHQLSEKMSFEIKPKAAYFVLAYDGPNGDVYSELILGIGFGCFYGSGVQIGVRGTLGTIVTNNEGIPDFNEYLLSGIIVFRVPLRW